MATVRNSAGNEVGDKKGIFPTSSIKGSLLSSESVDGESVVRMNGLGIGIYNAGSTDIILSVVLVGNDATNAIPFTIAGGELWQGGFFNAVAVAGSTGHLDSTTHYLYA